MARYVTNDVVFDLDDALDLLTVDDLKRLIKLTPGAPKGTRKQELVSCLKAQLRGKHLRALWDGLDELSKNAVKETVHCPDGRFDGRAFVAKYGMLPDFKREGESYHKEPLPIALFIFEDTRGGWGDHVVMPHDLRQRLLEFVPKPEALRVEAVSELPACFVRQDVKHEYASDDPGITIIRGNKAFWMPRKKPKSTVTSVEVPWRTRNTERGAVQEMRTMLRLVEAGKLAMSPKTNQPSASAIRQVDAILVGGDFYSDVAAPESHKRRKTKKETTKTTRGSQDGSTAAQAIRAFAWPLLLQAAGLARQKNAKLVLSKTGQAVLNKGVEPETLRQVWQSWVETDSFDELGRIDTLKGQSGKGKRGITAPSRRREAIVEALRACPVGGWVDVDALLQFMHASRLDLTVTVLPEYLHFGDARNANLEYLGDGGYELIGGRYVMAVLLEYAATLGLIDVAYVDPDQAGRNPNGELFLVQLDPVLSRYDGLIYLRVNPLGAYCLGLGSSYEAREETTHTRLHVLSNGTIDIVDGDLTTDEVLLLDAYAERETDTTWRLSRQKLIMRVEQGRDIGELKAFLERTSDQPLPEKMEGFIADTARRGTALKPLGTALLVECVDASVADFLATHKDTKALCQRAGERQLVLTKEAESKFRRALHALGYGMTLV